MTNIYWKDAIVSNKPIKLVGNPGSRSYICDGATVFWHGSDAPLAQQTLDGAILSEGDN